MKELSDVINNIKFGSILCIDHYICSNKNMYNSYLKEYDGDIFLDVKTVNLGNLLEHLSNIKKLLNEGYSYQLLYDFMEGKFQSTIYKGRNINQKVMNLEDCISAFQTSSSDYLIGMIELDAKIASDNTLTQKEKIKMQVMA